MQRSAYSSKGAHLQRLGLLLVVIVLLAALPPAAAAGSAGQIAHNQSPAASEPLGPIRLVKDINPNLVINTRHLGTPLIVSGLAYFSAETPNEGTELWKSDGTAAGTAMVADLVPGLLSSSPRLLAGIGGKLVFTAEGTPTPSQRGLWVSDGTAQGTLPLTANSPMSSMASSLQSIVMGNRLFFEASDPDHGNELWVSDGTPQGTRLLADLNPGTEGSNPHSMTVSGSRLYFFTSGARGGAKLWKSDGTAQGTQEVASFPNDIGGSPIVLKGVLLFAGTATATGSELWRSDGSAQGTWLVADINPGAESSYPLRFVEHSGSVLFTATSPAYGSELWRSDGTAAGTRLVADLAPGSSSSGISSLTSDGSTTYFFADYPRFGYNLWKSDGTPEGTTLLADLPAPNNTKWESGLVRVGNAIFFFADDSIHGPELWRSDGTQAGTRMVADLNPGAEGSMADPGIPIVDLNGVALLVASTAESGKQLWRSDGTQQGTRRVSGLNVGLGSGSQPLSLTPVDDEVLFTAAATAERRWTLWRSDGSTRGTQRVFGTPSEAIFPLSAFPSTTIIPAGRELFILVSAIVDQDVGCSAETRLYRQTAAGPLLLGSFAGMPAVKCMGVAASGIYGATAFQGQLFFLTLNGELWKSDGTPEGTSRLKRLGDTLWLYWSRLLVFRGALYFLTYGLDASTAAMLWRSDGTSDGTQPIAVFDSPSGLPMYSGPQWNQLQQVGGHVFFTLASGESFHLWVSDGTTEGTRLLIELARPAHGVARLGEKVLFVSGAQLFVSDGTAQGTRVVRTFSPDQSNIQRPALSAVVNQTYYFCVADGPYGYELWQSDGSAAGTRLVKDITPGTAGEGPLYLTAAWGRLLFSADDGVHGRELWQSDGSAAGTQMVADLAAGGASSNPAELTPAAGTIFFSAETPQSGRELFAFASAEGVDLTLDAPARVGGAPGGVVPLRVSYRNRGAAPALSSTLQIDLGPELRYQGDSSGITPTISGTRLSWSLADLASMEHGALTLLLGLPPGVPGNRFGLQIAIGSAGSEARPGDNQAAAEIWLARQMRMPLLGN